MRSETHLKSIAICAVIVLLGSGYALAGTWTTLDYPGTGGWTQATGISGNNIVGRYQDNSGNIHGCLYNGGSWTGLPIIPSCIDGSTIVSHADGYVTWLYNLTTGSLTPASVEFIGSSGSEISGISGDSVIGMYYGRSFLYNTTTRDNYTFFDYPGIYRDTYAQGISGNSVVGYYYDGDPHYAHGFLYNITTQSYTALNYPGATGETIAQGISGNNIVGQYWDNSGEHGFLYNGTSWTTLDYPGAINTYALGISGNNIVGWSSDGHGFLYEIPEPATLLLLGLGAVVLRKRV
jgi:hypothetical protein